jgi:hypothetical protein
MRQAATHLRRFATEIRDNELYAEKGYDSFRAYCEGGEISVGYSRASELIRGAEIKENLSVRTDAALPETQMQIRPLRSIKDPDEQAKVWDSAVEANDGKAPSGRQKRSEFVWIFAGSYHTGQVLVLRFLFPMTFFEHSESRSRENVMCASGAKLERTSEARIASKPFGIQGEYKDAKTYPVASQWTAS